MGDALGVGSIGYKMLGTTLKAEDLPQICHPILVETVVREQAVGDLIVWSTLENDHINWPLYIASTPPKTLEELGWTLTTEAQYFYPSDENASPPSTPSKPYNQAVNDVHRYLKEIVQKAPVEQIEGSVKEGVIGDLDKAIEKREAQKSWPATLR